MLGWDLLSACKDGSSDRPLPSCPCGGRWESRSQARLNPALVGRLRCVTSLHPEISLHRLTRNSARQRWEL